MFKNMLDIHCHLIPGIDDGAKELVESLVLLRIAKDDGIKRMVITPHLHLGRYENFTSLIKFKLLRLRRAIEEAGIDIELQAASEVRLDSEIINLIAEQQVPMYGFFEGQQFMLLELPHSHMPNETLSFVKYLKKQNITPVIAHPERNRGLLKSPEKINSLVRAGCWFQLTAGSITGDFGPRCQDLSLQYLKQGIVNIVATDAHNTKHRPPILSKARAEVVNILGEAQAQELFWQNPYNITASLFD